MPAIEDGAAGVAAGCRGRRPMLKLAEQVQAWRYYSLAVSGQGGGRVPRAQNGASPSVRYRPR
jgi:hypothetical protein